MTDPSPRDSAGSAAASQAALAALRERAERRRLATEPILPGTPAEMQRLIQELQVYQIELEMQYEELLLAQAQAEASRAQYLDLYEFAPVGYCTLLPNGTILQLNLHVARLLDTVRQQLTGRQLALFVAPAYRASFADFKDQLFTTGLRQSITVEMRRADGTPLQVRLEGLPTPPDADSPQVRLALIDVTEQHQAMQCLALSEQRFRTLFEQSQDGIVLLRNNRFVDCNQTALQLLGLHTKQDLLGKHASAFSSERQPNGVLSVGLADTYWQQTLDRGHVRFEWCRQRADGQEFWEDILQTAIPEPGGPLVHAVWRDITTEKQAVRSLRESEQRLRHALDASALGVIDWNLSTNELYWDERAQAIFGYPHSAGPHQAEEAMARVHPQDQARLRQLFSNIRPDQTIPELEYRVIHSNGQEGYVTMTGRIAADRPNQQGRLLGLVRDITASRAVGLELSYKNRLLQHILAHMPVVLARLTPQGEYVELTGAGLRRLALHNHTLVGQSVFKAFPRHTELIQQLLHGQEISFLTSTEYDGEHVFFQSYGFFDKERNQGVLFAIDVTENERRRAQLQQEQKFTQSLLDNSVDVVIAFDAELHVTAWNRQAEHYTCIMSEQVLGRPFAEALPKLALDAEFTAMLHRTLAGESIQQMNRPGRYFSGRMDLNLLPLPSPTGANGILLLARDVTQREQLLAETTRLKLREQQVVLSAILSTQEEERRRIAEALHNGVGQLLYATSLHLDHLPSSEPVRNSKQLLKEAVRATRHISFELTPGILEDFGLTASLQELARRIPRNSLCVHMRLAGLENDLPTTLQIVVYRSVQELLNNVMKHAQAQEAHVLVVYAEDTVELKVQDDGKGFDAANVPLRSGIGLAGTRNRVKLLGGELQIASQPGQGTTVSLSIPVPHQESGQAYSTM